MIRGVPVEELEAIWPKVAPMLVPALVRWNDNVTTGDVYRQIETQQSMLWVTEPLTMALVLTQEDGALFAWLIGGVDLDEWVDEVNHAMKRYAREYGLTHIKGVVRPGLARRLRKHGWRTEANIVRSEI